MGVKEQIINIAGENNGIVTSEMITSMGISRGNLMYLVEKGILEKSARGVYILPEVWDDEMFNYQVQFKRGIYSHETSLFLWGITDRTPSGYSMTFPTGYNLTKVKSENINCFQCQSNLYELGVSSTKTPGGNIVSVYNVERTLCDILRKTSHTDIQIVSEAFKKYTSDKNKNIPLLSEYAKILRVEKKLRSYLEVLL